MFTTDYDSVLQIEGKRFISADGAVYRICGRVAVQLRVPDPWGIR
jgi:hypothetical protein